MTSRPVRPPDIAEAAALVAAVEEGSLARAGARLGISQPAMTKRIRALEALAGVTLLERDRTGVRPTPAGASLARDAARLVAEAERFAQATASLRVEAPPLRVAVLYAIAESVLPQWLGEVRAADGVRPVEVRVGTPSQVRDWVLRGESDLGVAAGAVGGGLVEWAIGVDELVAVVREGHPWARAGRVGAAELCAEPMALREPGSGTRTALDDALGAVGLPPSTAALALASNQAIRAAVRSQGMPAVLSRLALEGEAAQGLVGVPVEGLDLQRPLVAVWRRGARLTAAHRAFLAAASGGRTP